MAEDGKLSPHFSKAEFACKHCGKLVIDMNLIKGLEALRALIGKPIKITSGYRCPEYNKKIGGAPQSLHTTGKAADIQVTGMTIHELMEAAEKIPIFNNGGIGKYYSENIVHVDIRAHRLRWVKKDGKYSYYR